MVTKIMNPLPPCCGAWSKGGLKNDTLFFRALSLPCRLWGDSGAMAVFWLADLCKLHCEQGGKKGISGRSAAENRAIQEQQGGKQEKFAEKTLEQRLDGRFFKCHRSYLVNLDCLKSCQNGRAFLANGESVPVSRLRGRQFSAAVLRRSEQTAAVWLCRRKTPARGKGNRLPAYKAHTRQSVSALTAQNFFHARYTAETQARWRHTEALRAFRKGVDGRGRAETRKRAVRVGKCRSRFVGNTVTLDPANPAPSLLHLPMLLVQLLSMLSRLLHAFTALSSALARMMQRSISSRGQESGICKVLWNAMPCSVCMCSSPFHSIPPAFRIISIETRSVRR